MLEIALRLLKTGFARFLTPLAARRSLFQSTEGSSISDSLFVRLALLVLAQVT